MINNTFQKQKHLYIAFFLFFAQFFILDAYYFDDLFRAHEGYFGWSGDGRALGGFLYKILLNFQSPLADIYPIPLIVTGVLFCFIIYHFCLSLNITCQKQQILILLLLIANPLILSNWLFRYDSAFMLASISFALIPFCILHIFSKKWMIYSVLSLLGALMTYQIAINIFIGFTAIFAFKLAVENNNFKTICYFIIRCIIALLLAYVIYSKAILTIMPMHWLGNKYQQIPHLQTILTTVYNNIIATYNILNSLLKNGVLYPLLLSLIFNFYAIDKYITTSKIRVIFYYFIALVVTVLSVSGVMLISETAPFIARTFFGVIPFLSFPIIVLTLLKHYKLFFISAIYLCLTMLVIDRAALNATNAEIKHQNTIAQQIMTEASINHITKIEQIMILGKPTKSSIAKISEQTYPITSAILPHTFSGPYDGGRYIMMFNGYSKTTYPEQEQQKQLTQKIKSSIPIASNPIYKLYYINQVLIINFEN